MLYYVPYKAHKPDFIAGRAFKTYFTRPSHMHLHPFPVPLGPPPVAIGFDHFPVLHKVGEDLLLTHSRIYVRLHSATQLPLIHTTGRVPINAKWLQRTIRGARGQIFVRAVVITGQETKHRRDEPQPSGAYPIAHQLASAPTSK